MLPHSPLSASAHLPHLQDQLPWPTVETSALFIPGPIHTTATPPPALRSLSHPGPLSSKLTSHPHLPQELSVAETIHCEALCQVLF